MKKLFALLGVSLLAPTLVSAATSCSQNQTPGTIGYVACKAGDILNLIIPILVVLGIVYFVWGVISYVIGGDEESKKKGRNKMISGIIGLVVIVAMWGLVGLITKTFDLDGPTTNIYLPNQIQY